MNITGIQTFLTVTRIGNLNRAAEELHVTQSTVTARLDSLDQALGAKLLNRSRKGATLTKAGFAFLEQAELIVTTWASARVNAGLPRGATQLFSLVCDPSLWFSAGRAWIEHIKSEHPQIAVEVWPGLTTDAQSWLQSGMSDAALLPNPLASPEFDNRLFATEDLIQVATHPRKAIRWDPEYIFVDYGPAFRTDHTRVWKAQERAALSFSNPDWALSHMLEFGGTAYLPAPLVAPYIKSGALFPIDGTPVFTRCIYLSWRKASEAEFTWLSQAT